MHKMKHSNEFLHPCADCTMVFRSSSEMNKHRVRKHKQPGLPVKRDRHSEEVSSTLVVLVLGTQFDGKAVTEEENNFSYNVNLCKSGSILNQSKVPMKENYILYKHFIKLIKNEFVQIFGNRFVGRTLRCLSLSFDEQIVCGHSTVQVVGRTLRCVSLSFGE
jgi:hypothetical protein